MSTATNADPQDDTDAEQILNLLRARIARITAVAGSADHRAHLLQELGSSEDPVATAHHLLAVEADVEVLIRRALELRDTITALKLELGPQVERIPSGCPFRAQCERDDAGCACKGGPRRIEIPELDREINRAPTRSARPALALVAA